jgi:hypothetical protein
MTIEEEIRDTYKRMGYSLAVKSVDKIHWCPISQYGYVMDSMCETQEQAEKYVITYYTNYINLIRQA